MAIKDKEYHRNWYKQKVAKETPEQKASRLATRRAWIARRRAQGLQTAYRPKDWKKKKSENYYKQKYGEFWEAKMLLNLFYDEMRRNIDYEEITQLKADKKRRPTTDTYAEARQRRLDQFKELLMGYDAGRKEEGSGPDDGERNSASG